MREQVQVAAQGLVNPSNTKLVRGGTHHSHNPLCQSRELSVLAISPCLINSTIHYCFLTKYAGGINSNINTHRIQHNHYTFLKPQIQESRSCFELKLHNIIFRYYMLYEN